MQQYRLHLHIDQLSSYKYKGQGRKHKLSNTVRLTQVTAQVYVVDFGCVHLSLVLKSLLCWWSLSCCSRVDCKPPVDGATPLLQQGRSVAGIPPGGALPEPGRLHP